MHQRSLHNRARLLKQEKVIISNREDGNAGDDDKPKPDYLATHGTCHRVNGNGKDVGENNSNRCESPDSITHHSPKISVFGSREESNGFSLKSGFHTSTGYQNSSRSRENKNGAGGRSFRFEKCEKLAHHGVSTMKKKQEYLSSTKYHSTGSGYFLKSDHSEQGQSYLEDPQLSKLVNRVMREDERERRLSACRQLKDYIVNEANANHIQKMGFSLAQELSRILFDRTTSEVKCEVSNCTALLASALDKDLQSYLRWLFRKYNSTNNEEAQIFLLHSLLQLIKCNNDKDSFVNNVPMIMEEIQTALEVTDSQQLLIAIVDIVLVVADRYADIFESHFRDTVDILVGWHIDPQQAEPILNYTSKALIRFHQYWVADISFSVTLLGQFLEDIEAYADELTNLDENQKDEDEDLPEKISSLLRVYTTVIKSLKEHFNPDFCPRITAAFITDNFSRLLSSLLKTINVLVSDVILIAANECIALLLSRMKDSALPYLEQISSLMDAQMADANYLSNKLAFSLLSLATQVVSGINNRLPPEFLGKLLGSESLFPKMRLWSCNKIQEALLELYRSIFRLKTVPLLEEAYRFIFTDLQHTFNCLLDWSVLPSVQSPVTNYDQNQALSCSIFDLCAIAEIGNNKHSLIAMLAFHPSIFDLLTVHLRPVDSALAMNYPVLQYSILFTLYSHCANHGYFLTSSSLLNAVEVNSTDRPTTSNHFTAILDLLSQLLICSHNGYDIRLFVLKWCKNLVSSAINYLEQISSSAAFVGLLHSLIASGFLVFDNELAYYTASVLTVILNGCWWKLPQDVLGRCFELCLVKMADFNDDTRAVFEKLFVHLPLEIVFKNPNTICIDSTNQSDKEGIKMNGIQSIFEARRRLQSRSFMGTFTSQDLRTILDFIFLGCRSKKKWSWLTNMFVVGQRTGKLAKSDDQYLSALAKSNQGVVWFWSAYEAALFCVLSKLRTPLGKPQDTLATIEVAVKNFTAEVMGQANAASEVTRLNGSDPLYAHLRIKVLLDFMEQLEKMMYNAYEGCAVSLPAVPKAVKIFFRTNKTTCQEWLARVRKTSITLALHLGYPAFAVRNAFHLVRSLYDGKNTQDSDFQHAVFLLVQGLVALHSPDAILGLYLWIKQDLGIKMSWIKPAVDLASGRYEDAAHEFNCVLKNEAPTPGNQFSASVNNFMRNQVLESLRSLGSWSEVNRWIKSEESKWGDSEFLVELNQEHIRRMTDFDSISENLIDYDFNSFNSETDQSASQLPLQFKALRQKAEKVAVDFVLSNETGREELISISKQLSSMIKLGIMEAPLNIPLESVVLNHMIKRLGKENNGVIGSEFSSNNIEGKHMAALVQAVRWLPHVTEISLQDENMRDIYLTAAKSARKNQNIHAAQRWMLKGLAMHSEYTSSTPTLINRLKSLSKTSHLNVIDARYVREGSKLLYRLDHSSEAVQVLSSKVNTLIERNEKADVMTVELRELSKLNAKSILTLAKWTQFDSSILSVISPLVRSDPINGYRSSQTHKGKEDSYLNSEENYLETTVYSLLLNGTKHCPWLAKAWLELASWCYKSGKKAVDRAGETGIELTSEEVNQISALMSKNSSEDDIDFVRQILSRVRIVESDEHLENQQEVNRQRILSTCSSLTEFSIDSLLSIWQSITDRVYSHYRTACEAYFTFLELNGSSVCDEPLNEDGNTTATLRLLRLMVKHATELRSVFEIGLAKTPVSPWKGIILQLFARLNHPEPYVSRSISELLCRITAAVPHLIIFPAVVGSSAMPNQIKNRAQILGECLSPVSDDVDGSDDRASLDGDGPDAEIIDVSEQQDQAVVMQNCFAVMVDTLAKDDPKSVAEVQRFVHELRRITLLWDELWLGTLSQYHLDFTRRIAQLEKEIGKVKTNMSLNAQEKTDLIAKKHSAFLKPTLFVLEQLQLVTSQTAETPHEKWFQETFGVQINDTISKLKKSSTPDQPQISSQIYKQLLYNLQQRVQKRSSLVLYMHQISPALSAMKSTGIAMPIAHTQAQSNSKSIVTIDAIDNVVSILPTKTKPKKLVFYGSDGRRYPFLFKGLEDLHLDERIMQLLTIVNNMFLCNKRNVKSAHYRARHYSVTPLGPRSGLIQWVERATPLFGLYKRWQQREATAPNQKLNPSNNQNAPIRPSEIYYSKLTPLLKEQGIVNLGNRKEWPLSVLCQVLSELMAETPNDLLAKELWCTSTSAFEWWTITENYARSVAVMSVIGYIIGLGDRHLDNVLVDLGSGEVIHIDYNVCFEKGKNLRVPEKVPFRMTPNIKTALGLTGVEGTFRVSCEHALKTLRRGRETLLTLLEAFVYDPLIDWTPGSEGGYTGAAYGGWQGGATSNMKQSKQEMEFSLLNDMFQIRMAEMKTDWLNNQEEILGTLPKLEKLFNGWIEIHNCLQLSEEKLQDLHQQMAMLKEAEANHSHPLHTLPQRCGDYLLTKERVKTARSALEEKLKDCDRWHQTHKSALNILRGQELNRWRVAISNSLLLEALSLPPVVEFLQAAGKAQLLQQCDQTEKDIAGLLIKQQSLLKSTIEALTTYSAIVGQLPDSYVDENRNYCWRQWLQDIYDNFSLPKCNQIITQFQTSSFGNEGKTSDIIAVKSAMDLNRQLQNLSAEVNTKLLKLVERLQVESNDNILVRPASVEESHLAITNYIDDQEKCGYYSITCAAISMLAGHCRRLGVMESAALAAGDRLADYTSRDGDWFLDEIYFISANMDELISVLLLCRDVLNPIAISSYKAINACHQVVSSLQDLHLNFRTIILPEALKCIQREDLSVTLVFDQLEALVKNLRIPLSSLIQQMELQVRNVVMEMEPPASRANQIVEEFKRKCQPLLEGGSVTESLSPGQMLLMGFNGLFTKLESDFWHFRDCSLPILSSMPTSWRKVDVIREARSIMVPSFLEKAISLLNNIFFVKRLQTILEVFKLLKQHCAVLNGVVEGNIAPLYSEETMTRPVRCFIAEFIGKMMLGLQTQGVGLALCHSLECCNLDVSAEIDLRDIGAESKVSMDDLCRKTYEFGLRRDLYQLAHFTLASSLLSDHERIWKRQTLINRFSQNILILKSVIQRGQLQVAQNQWINERLLIQSPNQVLGSIPTRLQFISAIAKNMQSLLALESSLAVAGERYLSLGNSVEQRLRWAAGANPSVNSTLEEYERSLSSVNQIIITMSKTSTEVTSVCGSILHLETMKSQNAEALATDTSYFQLITLCQESCLLEQNYHGTVSALEEKLLSIESLEKHHLSSEWIERVGNSIADQIVEVQCSLNQHKLKKTSAAEAVRSHMLIICTHLATNHRLINEVRSILKSMAKFEEQTSDEIGQYLASYKAFSEQFASLVKEALAEEFTIKLVESFLTTVEKLKIATNQIYDKLVALSDHLEVKNMEKNENTRESNKSSSIENSNILDDKKIMVMGTGLGLLSGASPNSQQTTKAFPTNVVHLPKKEHLVVRDPRTGKAVQQRNSYAVSVWKRVKMKLDGRDPDGNRRSNIVEQVDYIIKEATDLENLATLYEGWTPWV